MRRRIALLLSSQAGNVMVSNIIGAATMLIVAGAIATGIVGLLAFQGAVNERTAVTKEVSLADSVFRSDVQWASAIAVTDDRTVELTVPGRNGLCKLATWTITQTAGKTAVNSTVISYPGYDATVNPVRCSGTGSAPATQTLIADAGPAAAFTYANAAGRAISYVSGAAALDLAPAPSGADPKLWESPDTATITLSTEVASSTPTKASYRISQSADNLHTVQQTADAPSHFIPEGNLTALPAG